MTKRRLKKDLLQDIEVLQNQLAIAKNALKEIALGGLTPKMTAHETLKDLGCIPIKFSSKVSPQRVYLIPKGFRFEDDGENVTEYI